MSTPEVCDVCGTAAADRLVFLGWTELEGQRFPEVKALCGGCPLPAVRPDAAEAKAHFLAGLRGKR